MPILTSQNHETKPLTSGQQATLQIPVYGTIHNLILRFATAAGAAATEAQIRAEVGNIRLTFNGRDIVNTSVSRLFDLYEALGNRVAVNAGVAGNVELNLARLMYTLPEVQMFFGFGTQDVNTIQVSVTAGTLTNVASVQAITTRDNIARILGAHGTFIDYPQSFNATGDHTVDTLPRDQDSAYGIVLVDDGASGTITFGEVRVNNVTITERCPSDTNQLKLSSVNLIQPSGYFVHGFNDGSQNALLPMSGVTDFRVITTFSVAPGAAGYVITPLAIKGIAPQARA